MEDVYRTFTSCLSCEFLNPKGLAFTVAFCPPVREVQYKRENDNFDKDRKLSDVGVVGERQCWAVTMRSVLLAFTDGNDLVSPVQSLQR